MRRAKSHFHLPLLCFQFSSLPSFSSPVLSCVLDRNWDAPIYLPTGQCLARSKTFQLEQEMETVIRVLQPGPLGIIEHRFSGEEIREANATVRRAVENWRRNASLEQMNVVLKDYIPK